MKHALIKEGILGLLSESGLEGVYHLSRVQRFWDVVVQPPLFRKTWPYKLDKKILYIAVPDGAYRHHLQCFEKRILETVSTTEICGPGVVIGLIFEVREIKRRIESEPERPKKTQSKESLDKAAATSSVIKNPRLRKAFASVMASKLKD